MPFGEMTITLDDVNTLLSISVIGNSVSSNIQVHEEHTLVAHALGVIEAEATEELEYARGQSVSMKWLWSRFQGRVGDHCGHEEIRCSAKAYLLYLIRCTLIADKTVTQVLIDYL